MKNYREMKEEGKSPTNVSHSQANLQKPISSLFFLLWFLVFFLKKTLPITISTAFLSLIDSVRCETLSSATHRHTARLPITSHRSSRMGALLTDNAPEEGRVSGRRVCVRTVGRKPPLCSFQPFLLPPPLFFGTQSHHQP